MNENNRIYAFRFRHCYDPGEKPKKYSHTYRIAPEGEQDLYRCDIIRHVTSRETVFKDAKGAPCFSMRPNRKIMPTKWPLTDADGRPLGYLDQKIVKKATWVAFGPGDEEVYRIVETSRLSEKLVAGFFNGVAFKWALMREGELVGGMERESRDKEKKKGLRKFLKFLTNRKDWVVRYTPHSREIDPRLLAAGMVLFIDINTPVH